ncbi:MAG TPA: BMP family ABC transporter substrate-binding protein, partial [Pseudodesulfovibrio sp.]|nr:BMP family ABC transporter substrate-binding protein [Pseudodesulfovibrio sp.]
CEGQGGICLGVPYFNWGPNFLKLAKAVADGSYKPGFEWDAPYWADINNPDESPVGFMPGPGMSAETKAELAKFTAKLGSGELNLFTGPLNHQDGTPFLKAGEKATDKQIWYMEQLLEGMEGQSSPQ